jgi:hypothetical protein
MKSLARLPRWGFSRRPPMIRSRAIVFVQALPILALCACVPPRAVIVEKAPETKKEKPAEVAAVPAELPDDDIRLPEDRLLTMPGDGEFRSNPLPLQAGPAGAGGVIVRPPTDPPPRPKPRETENP